MIGVHGILIVNRKTLVVRKGTYNIFPGGKLRFGESDKECLIREIKEELSNTEIEVKNYYGTFTGLTPNSNVNLESRKYFYNLKGKLGKPSAEINESMFVNSKDFKNLNLTEVSKKTLDALIKDNLID